MLELTNVSLQINVAELIKLAREYTPPIILSTKDAIEIADIFREAMLGNIQDELEFAFNTFDEGKKSPIPPTTYKVDLSITGEFCKEVSIEAKSKKEALEKAYELIVDDREILDNWEYAFDSIEAVIDGERLEDIYSKTENP